MPKKQTFNHMKIVSLLLGFIVLINLSSCGLSTENEKLRKELEAMKTELNTEKQFMDNMTDEMNGIDVLLDSIEASQDNVNINLEKGTSYDDHVSRLRRMKDYLEQTENKLQALENKFAKTNSDNKHYQRMIREYRKNLTKKDKLITALQGQIEGYKAEKTALIKTVDLQRIELENKDQEIELKRAQLETLERNIQGVKNDAKKAQADAYFVRAETQEELAKRTKLAPKKRKAAYKKAYDLYKKAFETGRTDAYAKMEALDGKF